jgi:uncharacterized protein
MEPMAKILIVSDSHGLEEEVAQLAERHGKDADLMIHCGDSELPAGHPAMSGFAGVRGNCDYDDAYPDQLAKNLGGLTIFVTHGHLYGVKSSLMKLNYKGEEEGADIICFGHSHELGAEMIDGRLFLNPGSLRLPRGRYERSYLLLETAGREIRVDIYDLEAGKLEKLSQTFRIPERA